MVLDIQNLKFKYSPASPLVLDIAKLQVNKAEKVFLYGPSGSGKTTLLEILAGILKPQEGTLQILNHAVHNLSGPQRDRFRADHIGYIFQSFNLIPYLTVLENITLPLYMSPAKRSRVPQKEEQVECLKLCRDLGIEDLLYKKVTELSVGQQQRVAAARAILGQPELILADEPTSSLDYDHREKFVKLLFEVTNKHQITVIFVSHDRSLQHLFDRAIFLPDVNKASRAESSLGMNS